MRIRGSGTIVDSPPRDSSVRSPCTPVHSASKFALESFLGSLVHERVSFRIRVLSSVQETCARGLGHPDKIDVTAMPNVYENTAADFVLTALLGMHESHALRTGEGSQCDRDPGSEAGW